MKRITIENVEFKRQFPQRLVWVGAIVILVGLLILLSIAWLLEYSNKVKGVVTITTPSKPIELPAPASGALQLFVQSKDQVEQDAPIGFIKNAATYEHIQQLKGYLEESERPAIKAKTIIERAADWQLGELELPVLELKAQYQQYASFLSTNAFAQRISSNETKIALFQERIALLEDKIAINKANDTIAQDLTQRKTRLADRGAISKEQSALAQQSRLDKAVAVLEDQESINSFEVQIEQLRSEIIDYRSQLDQQTTTFTQAIALKLDLIATAIKNWEDRFLILAPRSGQCIFKEGVEQDRYWNAGVHVCTIVPNDNKAIANMSVPISNNKTGKVTAGQPVNIFLNNFPASEYGIVRGEVKQIAPLPENGQLQVEVALPHQLVSTYGYTLPFQQLSTGYAEIITDRMNFLTRVWNELRGIVDKRTVNPLPTER